MWYVIPYQRIVPKLKEILFDFHNIAGVFVRVSIPTDMKNHRFAIFLRFVNDLQTPKQDFPFTCLKVRI